MSQLTLFVLGMTCQKCVAKVRGTLLAQAGVGSVEVSLAQRQAVVGSDAPLDRAALIAALLAAGFQVADTLPPQGSEAEKSLGYRGRLPDSPEQPGRLSFGISGMHCASCARTLETALSALPGMTSVSINLAQDRGSVRFDPDVLDQPRIFAAVEAAGYLPGLAGDSAAQSRDARLQLRWLLFSAACSLSIMLFMFLPVSHAVALYGSALLARWCSSAPA